LSHPSGCGSIQTPGTLVDQGTELEAINAGSTRRRDESSSSSLYRVFLLGILILGCASSIFSTFTKNRRKRNQKSEPGPPICLELRFFQQQARLLPSGRRQADFYFNRHHPMKSVFYNHNLLIFNCGFSKIDRHALYAETGS